MIETILDINSWEIQFNGLLHIVELQFIRK